MTTTLERSLSRNSSTSLTSPRISFKNEASSPPTIPDPSLSNILDRLNALDAHVLDLRSAVLTKDGYVDRRNREDRHISREFETHHSISSRIDLNVVALRTDVDQLRSKIFQLSLSVNQSENNVAFLRSDIDRLQTRVDQLQADVSELKTDVSVLKTDVSDLKTDVSELKTDVSGLKTDVYILKADVSDLKTDTRKLAAITGQLRMDVLTLQSETRSRLHHLEARMEASERARFNSLACDMHSMITVVPTVDDDGSLRWPGYFPRTVWRFWCLKKRSRIHRLVELAEFYQLQGYQYWCQSRAATLFGAGGDSDSDSSDDNSNLTLADAVRMYPESAHQALASTLGLVYHKIRKGVEADSRLPPRPPKRQQEEESNPSSTKQKPVKIARRPNNDVSPTTLHKLTTGPMLESKSMISDKSDKLEWDHRMGTDDATHTFRDISAEEVGTLLRALEQGRLKLKPSRSERMKMSPAENQTASHQGALAEGNQNEEERVATVPTEVASPSSSRGTEQDELPDTASVPNE